MAHVQNKSHEMQHNIPSIMTGEEQLYIITDVLALLGGDIQFPEV